jgi:putative transposase
MWNLPPPPGFQGLRQDLPLTCYERHLPHWRQHGATYFVTFRLNDSLPQSKLHELEGIRREWQQKHPQPRTNEQREELARETARRIELWLDQGFGSCILRESQCRAFVVEAMHHFDVGGRPSQAVRDAGQKFDGGNDVTAQAASGGRPSVRYELGCYVVMPNHVHVVVRPLDAKVHSLETIIGSWKQFSGTRINRTRRLTGEHWQEECFDRIIRDEEHLWRVIQYIGRNPVRANLPSEAYSLWIRPQWEALGWRFEKCHP